jgi:hypothetical protein
VTFLVNATHNIVVKDEDKIFLIVKRKFGIGIRSAFFRKDQLVFDSFMFPFIKPFVTIKYQNLFSQVLMCRERGLFYSILYDDVCLSMKLKVFKNPDYFFFKNGVQCGYMSCVNDTHGRNRLYKIETDIEDQEDINLLFMILLFSQIRLF